MKAIEHIYIDGIEMKVCPRCKQAKSLSEWNRHAGRRDGLHIYCKQCRHEENVKSTVKKEYNQQYQIINKEKINERKREYYLEHRKEIISKINIYQQHKRKTDIAYRLGKNMSRLIHHTLKNGKYGWKWEDTVGYTGQELKAHLEKRFKNGMSWDNYGKWHVDHIIPKSAFHYESYNDIDFKRCWSLTNLQPMWGKENILKKNKLSKPFQPALRIAI